MVQNGSAKRRPTGSAKTTHYFQWLLFSLIGGFVAGVVGSLAVVSSLSQPAPAVVIEKDAPVVHVPVVRSMSTADIVSAVSPAVVSIAVEDEVSGFGGFQVETDEGEVVKQRVGGGSGFIISSDGLILTNRHVVSSETADFVVILNDGREFQGEVLARDPLNDIALIDIDAKGLPTLSLGDSDAIQIGQTVLAIGNALGEFSNSVTKGIVSGINRRIVAGTGVQSDVIESAIQTDAAINQGNSGGPLLNEGGRVIGINTAVSRDGQSIGFAIPVNTAKVVVDSFQEFGRIVRPWLGVRYVLINPELAELNNIETKNGAVVVGAGNDVPAVIPGSPAEKAGLLENDVIISINDVVITEQQSPSELIGNRQVGDVVTMVVVRDGEEVTLTATLEELDETKL